MNVTELVVGFFGLFLVLFGIAFAVLGMNSERSYWAQRDTHGDPRKDATPFSTIVKRAGKYATGEFRAPLRIAAIGVILIYIGIAFFILGLLIWIF